MSQVLDEHRQYLDDPRRMAAYQRAIATAVRPGDVVVDLGAGTGILGLLACRAGAARVYAIEHSSLIELTRQIAAASDFADRIVHIREMSTKVELPERVDVVLCDQVGSFGFDAGILDYFSDAARRFAKDDARFVPGQIELEVAPAEMTERGRDVAFWDAPRAGFDVSAAAPIARNSRYCTRIEASQILGPTATVARVDTTCSDSFSGRACLTIGRPGTLHGLAGWFRAELVPGVYMTSSPLADDRMARWNSFLPIDHPVEVSEGDRVDVHLHVIPRELLVTWKVAVTRSGNTETFTHSSFNSLLIAKKELARTNPAAKPVLTPWAEAQRTVLALCDGEHSVAAIEQEVLARHGSLFPSASRASSFVADLISRHGT